jgi:phospholipase/carboxylesterase
MRSMMNQFKRLPAWAPALVLLCCVFLSTGCTRPEASQPSSGRSTQKAVAEQTAPPLEYLEYLSAGADTKEKLPVVLAIHGLGDSPGNYIGLYETLPIEARIIAPRAPTSYGPGFSWFSIRIPFRANRSLGEGIGAAADLIGNLLDWLSVNVPMKGKPIVTGFSQGGMISFAVAVRHPEKIRAAIPMSGAIPQSLLEGKPPLASRSVAIRALHGDADDMVPVEPARKTVRMLREKGWDVELKEYPGTGHTISDNMHSDLFAHIKTMIAR